jgi:hypothetical protein
MDPSKTQLEAEREAEFDYRQALQEYLGALKSALETLQRVPTARFGEARCGNVGKCKRMAPTQSDNSRPVSGADAANVDVAGPNNRSVAL